MAENFGRGEWLMGIRKRNPALDLVRIVATLCVISVHFFGKIGFYDVYMIGTRMYLMCVMRNFFMVCVPLFLMLTGYLMRNKRFSGRYYGGIVKTMVIYLLASAACCLYFKKSFVGFWEALFRFQAAEYSWYLEMYIGLFLLIPFLNAMYRGNSDRQNEGRSYKLALIATLLFATALPDIFGTYSEMLPNYLTQMYPITYYIMGCYLAEYGLNLRKRTCALLLIAVSLASGAVSFCQAGHGEFTWDAWTYFPSIVVAVQAVLTFSLISSLDLGKIPVMGKKLLAQVSNLCLGIYLVSQIFDDALYEQLNLAVEGVGVRLLYFPIMVCAVFLCSLVLSAVMELIYVLLCRGCSWIKSKIGSGIPLKQ